MTFTFRTFAQPDGTFKYRVKNGPMVLKTGLCRDRKSAEIVARAYIKSGQAERKAMSFAAYLETV